MSVVDDSYGHPLRTEEKATMPLAGGIANQGYQCGMLWGGALAAGAQTYRLHGAGPQAETEALIASKNVVESFRARTKDEINCLEITELNFQESDSLLPILKFFAKGGPIVCFRMAAGFAPEALSAINTAHSEDAVEASTSPVSCTAMLAQKMGASDMHTVMAAGLAGGIGLSGGGCGVLGAAMWLTGLKNPVEMDGLSYKGTWISELNERFLKVTDYEFECADIVGRQFENPDDHADYVQAGGCAMLIEALAVFE